MKHRFIRGNQIIPVLDNQFLPVLWTAAIPSNVFMEKMGIRNNPGIRSNFKVVVRGKPSTSDDLIN